MPVQKIHESKIIISSRKKLLPGEVRLITMPANFPVGRRAVILEYWNIKEKIQFLRQNLARASNRGNKTQHISITVDYLYEIGEKQKWKCPLTGDSLEFSRGGDYWGGKWSNPKSCTIDRIDSNKGYVKGNIQLVTWQVNFAKSSVDNNDFINLCKKVAKFNK
jgi:hypothetical protein